MWSSFIPQYSNKSKMPVPWQNRDLVPPKMGRRRNAGWAAAKELRGAVEGKLSRRDSRAYHNSGMVAKYLCRLEHIDCCAQLQLERFQNSIASWASSHYSTSSKTRRETRLWTNRLREYLCSTERNSDLPKLISSIKINNPEKELPIYTRRSVFHPLRLQRRSNRPTVVLPSSVIPTNCRLPRLPLS